MNAKRMIIFGFTKLTLLAVLALALVPTAGALPPGYKKLAKDYRPDSVHVVTVGVSQYQNNRQQYLANPQNDAVALSKLFQAQQDKLSHRMDVRAPLLNQNATAANVLQALRDLTGKAGPGSHSIICFAGHGGVNGQTGEYMICLYDRDLGWGEVEQALREVPGTVSVIIDCCEAGGAPKSDKIIVLAAGLSDQAASDGAGSNGLFTAVLLEGASGKADLNGDGRVTLAELYSYTCGKVGQMSKGAQTPIFSVPHQLDSAMPFVMLSGPAGVAPVQGTVPNFTGPSTGPVQGHVTPANFTGPISAK